MLLTSARGDAVLLRFLSWQVDAMLAVTVRSAVIHLTESGRSVARRRASGWSCREHLHWASLFSAPRRRDLPSASARGDAVLLHLFTPHEWG